MGLNDLIEDMADEILREDAKRQKKSLRKLGIIDERRERTIREREISESAVSESKRREW